MRVNEVKETKTVEEVVRVEYIAEDGQVYKSECPKGKVKNSVGAGDSMVAGFIAGYLESGEYKEALRKGLLTGSASAFSDNLATKEEVEELGKTFQL